MNYAKDIGSKSLRIHAIKLNTQQPFQWASGYYMPIYNDNRMHLWYPDHMLNIRSGFLDIMFDNGFPSNSEKFDFFAGTSTAGIPWAAILANHCRKPMVYVRDKPKDHGLKNQIEGIDAESDLQGKVGILIEDLVSTGGSSVAAVQAIRDANGICEYCFSIFNYGFDKPKQMFTGEIPFDEKQGRKLLTPCNQISLLTYDTLLETALEQDYITKEEQKMLAEWRADPFKWGEKHGFPKVERK